MFIFKFALLALFCLLQLNQASSEYDRWKLYQSLNSSLGHVINVHYFSSPGDKHHLNDYRIIDQDHFIQEERNNVVIVHGWNDHDSESHWMENLKNKAFAHGPNTNVFLVDWREQSNSLRPSSAAWYAHTVSQDLHNFLSVLLQSKTIQSQYLHLIGKGIGAHVCGLVAHRINEENEKVARITALDPFGPNFVSSYTGRKLSLEDATRVIVLHTSMGKDILNKDGKPVVAGGVNVFLNGGVHQPACSYMFRQSSHDEIFKVEDKNTRVVYVRDVTDPAILNANASINAPVSNGLSMNNYLFCDHNQIDNYIRDSQYAGQCQMVAYQCDSYQRFQQGKCSSCGVNGHRCVLMDMDDFLKPEPQPEPEERATLYHSEDCSAPTCQTELKTISYFVDTHHKPTYCVNHYQMSFSLDSLSGEHNGRIVIDLYNETQSVFRTFEVQGEFKPKQRYTYLIKSNNRLDLVHKATASFANLWTNYLKTGKRLHLRTFSLRYMSHIDYSERLRLSSKLCFDSFINGKSFLSKCPPPSNPVADQEEE